MGEEKSGREGRDRTRAIVGKVLILIGYAFFVKGILRDFGGVGGGRIARAVAGFGARLATGGDVLARCGAQ